MDLGDAPAGRAAAHGRPSIRDVITAEIAATRAERAELAAPGKGRQDEQALLALWHGLDDASRPADARAEARRNHLLKFLLPMLRAKANLLCRGDPELADEVVSQVQLNWVEDGLLRGFDPQRGSMGAWIYGAARLAHLRLRHLRFGRDARHQPLPLGTGIDGDLVDAFAPSVLGSPLRLDGLRRMVPEVLDDLRQAIRDKRHVAIDLKTGQSRHYSLKPVHLQLLEAALTGQFDAGAHDDKHLDLQALTGKQKAQNAEDWRVAMTYVRQHPRAADLLASLAPSSTLRAFNRSHQAGAGQFRFVLPPAQQDEQRHEQGHDCINDNPGMDRVVSRQPRHLQQAGDLAFWLALPMAERMAAVELLRQQAINPMSTPDVEPRLQRVCRIAQRQGR